MREGEIRQLWWLDHRNKACLSAQGAHPSQCQCGADLIVRLHRRTEAVRVRTYSRLTQAQLATAILLRLSVGVGTCNGVDLIAPSSAAAEAIITRP
jgi:hypothetical protein